MNRYHAWAAATVFCGLGVTASAQNFTPVDISGKANFTWTGQETDPDGTMGVYFPGGPGGQVTLGGTPFSIISNGKGFQAWNAYTASGAIGEQPNSKHVSVTFKIGVKGVTTVYTLINTYWYLAGPASDASLIFKGSVGATYVKHLVGGADIRGWCCSGTINNTTTVNVYTVEQSGIDGETGYLDMQAIALPKAFAKQTLETIKLVDHGASGTQRVILDGITVATAAPQ